MPRFTGLARSGQGDDPDVAHANRRRTRVPCGGLGKQSRIVVAVKHGSHPADQLSVDEVLQIVALDSPVSEASPESFLNITL